MEPTGGTGGTGGADGPVYLTTGEAARRVGRVVAKTIANWIVRGCRLRDGTVLRLRAVVLGRNYGTRAEWLDQFLAALTADRLGPVEAGGLPAEPADARRERFGRERQAALRRLGRG